MNKITMINKYIIPREEFLKFMDEVKDLCHIDIIDKIAEKDWTIEQKLNVAATVGEMEWRERERRKWIYKES